MWVCESCKTENSDNDISCGNCLNYFNGNMHSYLNETRIKGEVGQGKVVSREDIKFSASKEKNSLEGKISFGISLTILASGLFMYLFFIIAKLYGFHDSGEFNMDYIEKSRFAFVLEPILTLIYLPTFLSLYLGPTSFVVGILGIRKKGCKRTLAILGVALSLLAPFSFLIGFATAGV